MSQIIVEVYHYFSIEYNQLHIRQCYYQLISWSFFIKGSRCLKKNQLNEHCGTQAKDHTNERAFQNHYRNHSAQWDVSARLVDSPGVDGFGRAMSSFGQVRKNHVGFKND